VAALLQPYDDKAKTLLKPLLLNPLQIVSVRLPTTGNGAFRPATGTCYGPKGKIPCKK
jgi:hypothetical protein